MIKPHYLLLLLLFSAFLRADILKENFITFDLNGTTPALIVDFESDNLEKFIMIDSNKNDIVSWKELYAKQKEIETFVLSHIDIAVDGKACTLGIQNFEVYRRVHQSYIKLYLNLSCALPKEALNLKYDLFFDVDKDQKVFVKLSDKSVKPLIMSSRKVAVSLNLSENTLWSSFVDFLIEGVWHIWIGFDHILFLLMLLIPSVYSSKHMPREKFTEVLKEILKITTAFTLAHSITLALSVTKVITLDTTFVEVAIALSVLFTALNNIFFFTKAKIWMIAFVFGLIHGFGFANVLHELLDQKSDFIAMLLGFNIGVELGQLAIVLALLPLLFFLRKSLFYKRFIMSGFSALTALIAILWALERTFNLSILPL
ncbi:MAG TPA: HupE/UreJ family protein [Campylobacterales bacterium]|nr:HupE/UreJ family protein [Campylobacterales bacterium]